ncbi:hypothetical protein TI05_05880 [Achromatium sp. WMS3]|nr:hypothetical protein TI05_05880 [Achromatium sp. WMS3]
MISTILIDVVKTAIPAIVGIFQKSTVTGHILDSDGKPVPNVVVLISDIEDISSMDGSFVIKNLSAGSYKISLQYGKRKFENVTTINVENGEKIGIKITIPEKTEQVQNIEENRGLENQNVVNAVFKSIEEKARKQLSEKWDGKVEFQSSYRDKKGRIKGRKFITFKFRLKHWPENFYVAFYKDNWVGMYPYATFSSQQGKEEVEDIIKSIFNNEAVPVDWDNSCVYMTANYQEASERKIDDARQVEKKIQSDSNYADDYITKSVNNILSFIDNINKRIGTIKPEL